MGVDDFLNSPENSKCKSLINDSIGDLCKDASNSGAACASSGLVGLSKAVCNKSSDSVDKKVSDMYDCQKRLYQHTVVETMNKLADGENELYDSIQDITTSFNLEVEIADLELSTDLEIIECMNIFVVVTIIVIILFLLLIVNFR